MIKKLLLILLCLSGISETKAQIRFGYLSYKKIIAMMPEYQSTVTSLNLLKEQCNQEARRAEDELERKYAEFLQGQSEFPEYILQKRQNELQALIQNGIKFRKESEAMLRKAERDMRHNVENKLNQTIEQIGKEYNLAFILNTDENSCPYINKSMGLDISQTVLTKLGIIKHTTLSVPESTTNFVKKDSVDTDSIAIPTEVARDSVPQQTADSTLQHIPDTNIIQRNDTIQIFQ